MVSARAGAAASSDQVLGEPTPGERQVAGLISQGLTNEPLAQRLTRPPGTVATHQAFTARIADLAARYQRSYARYQELDAASQTDTLHLFGVTSDDPPAYFYRTIENAIYGEKEPHRSTLYSPWRPVSLRCVPTPVSHRSALQRRPISQIPA